MSLDMPYRASRVAPVRALEALSSRVLHATLKATMGPYLDRLIEDYEDWAEGRARRQDRIDPEEASQLFLEAEASVVEGFAAANAEISRGASGVAEESSSEGGKGSEGPQP